MASTKAFVQADELNAVSGIRHAYFTREDGASSGIFASRNIGLGSQDDREAVLENRARCARDLGVAADKLATPYQIHSPNVITRHRSLGCRRRPEGGCACNQYTGLNDGDCNSRLRPCSFCR